MHVIAHERHVPIEIQVRELLFEARLRINFVQEAAADGPTVAIRIVLVVEQRRFLLFLGVQSDVLVVVGAGEAHVGAHLVLACGAGPRVRLHDELRRRGCGGGQPMKGPDGVVHGRGCPSSRNRRSGQPKTTTAVALQDAVRITWSAIRRAVAASGEVRSRCAVS